MVVMFYNLQAADVLSLSLTLVLTENGKWSTDSTALDRGDVESVNLSLFLTSYLSKIGTFYKFYFKLHPN